MDIVKILAEKHSKEAVQRITDYIGSDTTRFNQLITIFLEGPYRITQRAAWPMSYCVENNPDLIRPYLGKIIKVLAQHDVPVAIKRNIVRLLQFIKIPTKHAGEVSSLCLNFLANNKEAIAVRVFAMTVLQNIGHDIPEIKNELRLLIEDHLPYASPGFAARARKVLKELNH